MSCCIWALVSIDTAVALTPMRGVRQWYTHVVWYARPQQHRGWAARPCLHMPVPRECQVAGRTVARPEPKRERERERERERAHLVQELVKGKATCHATTNVQVFLQAKRKASIWSRLDGSVAWYSCSWLCYCVMALGYSCCCSMRTLDYHGTTQYSFT